jgi:hypothetical protein
MPVDPLRLLALCREIDETPYDDLLTLDREGLIVLLKELKALKKEVDRTLLRLAFVDEQQLN